MTSSDVFRDRSLASFVGIIGVTLLLAPCTLKAGGVFRNAAVGGVSIDTNGVLSHPTAEATLALRQGLRERLGEVSGELNQISALRKISLRQLEIALQDAVQNNLGRIPDDVKYLAGLQRIQYVLVYPEKQDIVLAGPGEGWTVGENGAVVGQTTGLPVVQLEDLLVAFQTVQAARRVGITCSIDPSEEGIQAFRGFIRQQKSFSPSVLDGIEKTLGQQRITVTGVPETSHFARILVAADYRMKRIAMRMESSPVKGIESFLDMVASSRSKNSNMMPRWWLATDYEPLSRSDDGLAWEIRGQGVKAMTEDDYVADDGTVLVTGKSNPIAAHWAQQLTQHYSELSKADPVFGQLRNLMDMCVTAAVIEKNGLIEKAGCEFPTIAGQNGDYVLESFNPPKSVATQCSFVKRGRNYIITASGGVNINSWQAAARTQTSAEVKQLRTKTTHRADSWWWN